MNHNCDFLRFYEPSQTRFQLYMFREIKKSYKANILQTKILKTGLKNYFFVKKKFKGNLNSACFLFYNSHCGMNTFFFPFPMPWQAVILLFQLGPTSNISSFAISVSYEGFLHQSLPLGHSRPFHRSTISFMSVSLLSLSSCDYRSQIS